MADGYLERRQQDYEARKAAWLSKSKSSRKKKPGQRAATRSISRPDDEAL